MAKLVNNKDGCSGKRWETYESACPNSYSVVASNGEWLGEFIQIKDPDCNLKVTAWIGMGQKFAYLSQAKDWVKANC